MSEKPSLPQRHPLLSGCLLLLVVGLLFWAGVSFLLGSLLRDDSSGFFISDGARQVGIGVIEIRGVITSADEIIAQLTKFRQQERIKAIVLRIDSPGGAVGATQELYAEVRRTNAVKPVVASMASVAASGGLYVALGAERIIANPGTITGSIGVVIRLANIEELLARIGYRSETLKSGELKDSVAIDRSMRPEERAMLQEMITLVHDQFITAIVNARNLPLETVQEFADGRIFTGSQALELQLIDGLGNLNDAALVAAELAGWDEGRVPTLIYPPRRSFSLLPLLLGGRVERGLAAFPLSITPVLAYEWTIAP
ncbi:MAG: signal peptide peptidase SppA [Desulfobulbaceae bacterium]|nr:MAG: signal peptide peptidase SppA [Desulfobulbaceae bacterium]